MRFNMKSQNFCHAHSSTLYKKSKHISWDFGSNSNHTSFYIDGDIFRGIQERSDGKRKFLWGLESRKFNNGLFDSIEKNLELVLETYEAIFTFNDKLIELHPKFKWTPAMGSWLEENDKEEKNKLVSMITSSKQITEEQKFRVEFAKRNEEVVDVYGSIKNPLPSKDPALNPYMFSVAIENDIFDTYFTEKILDCFSSSTIPIYRGTGNITRFFNPDGIIFLNGFEMPEISTELYHSKKTAIEDNLERVKRFNTVEDFIYENYSDILK